MKTSLHSVSLAAAYLALIALNATAQTGSMETGGKVAELHGKWETTDEWVKIEAK